MDAFSLQGSTTYLNYMDRLGEKENHFEWFSNHN